MQHVLGIGASKGIGLETVRNALEAGHQVRALARSATSISALQRLPFHVVFGAGLVM